MYRLSCCSDSFWITRDGISLPKRIVFAALFLFIMLPFVFTERAEAAHATVEAEGTSVVWKIGGVSIWRFPIAYEDQVVKAAGAFNEQHKAGFRIQDLKVSKINKQWVLCIKNTQLLTALPEHAGPIRFAPHVMSLVWLSRVYESMGELHADSLSQKYHLRGAYTASGTVSWYGGANMFGRKFANGERFEETHLTAAAQSLPFGTLVRVTAKDTGRSVVVRITDRFREHKNRVLDLSRAAAEILGIKNKGLASVKVEVLGKVGKIGGY